MKNCGKRFHDEVGKFRFLNELIKVVSPKVGPALMGLRGGSELTLRQGGQASWAKAKVAPEGMWPCGWEILHELLQYGVRTRLPFLLEGCFQLVRVAQRQTG